MDLDKFKSDIKAYCAENSITQGNLAKKSGISKSHFYGVMAGIQNTGELFWIKLEKATKGKIKNSNYFEDSDGK